MKKIISFIIAVTMCVSLAACSKGEKFDAGGYVESSLDAVYHAEFDEYIEYTGESKEAVEQTYEESAQLIMQMLTNNISITEEQAAAFLVTIKEMLALAKYEVVDTQETSGTYYVTLKVYTSNVLDVYYQKVMESYESTNYSEDISAYMANPQILKAAIDESEYTEETEIQIRVYQDDSGKYTFDNKDLERISDLLFVFETETE